MARIPSSRAPAGPIRQQALPAAGTEFRGGVVDAGSVGRGLQSLGAGLGAAAGAVANLQTRQEAVDDRASDFEVQRRFVEFQTQQNQRARDLQQNVAPGAFGYTQQVQKDYKEKADGFARTIPDRLRPEYDAKLAGLEGKFILNSDGFEREQRQAFYVDGIGTGFDELRESVIRGDVPYEQALQEGANLVDASGLTQLEKQKFMQSWRKDAAAALWRNEYEKDPAKALVAIGGGTPAQRQEYQVDRLRAAVMQQESGGDPNAVSPVGATGLMQVMPATGRDIAKQLGDGSFPANGTIAEQQAYLKRPEVSIRYGNFYLDQQLDKFGGDVEAALIAYNAGPGNAQKWLKAGRDYAALPKRSETEPYVRKIMGGLSGAAVDRQQFGQQEVGAGDFRSQFYTWADFRNDRFRDAKMDQAAVGALDQVTAAFGKGPLRITSGFRTTEHNAKASFTKDSRHTHGDAFDIDVSGYSPEEKAQLVSMFIASGARGLGHYTEGGAAGTIHVDFRQGKGKGPGGLALWLNQNKPYANGETWFSDGVNQGLAREGLTFSRNGPADPRFDALDYKTRKVLIGEAQSAVDKQRTGQQVDLSNIISEFTNYYAATGEQSGDPDVLRAQIDGLYAGDERKKNEIITAFDDALAKVELQRSVATATPDEVSSTLSGLQDAIQKPGNTARDTAKLEAYVGALANRNDRLAKDGAGYLESTDRPSEEFATQYKTATAPEDKTVAAASLVARQAEVYDMLGVPQGARSVLSKADATEIVSGIEAGDQGASATALSQFVETWGDAAPRVIADLEKAGLSPEYVVAMRASGNPVLANKIIGLRGQTQSDLAKGLPKTTTTDINAEMAELSTEYRAAYEAGDPSGQAAQTFNRSFDVAARLATSYARGGEDAGTAAETAFKEVFPEQVIAEDSQRFIAPEGVNLRVLGYRLDIEQQESALRLFDIAPLDDPRLPEFADQEVMIAAARNGTWLNNSTGDGVALTINVNGYYIPVTGKDGEPYQILFKDVTDNQPSREIDDPLYQE